MKLQVLIILAVAVCGQCQFYDSLKKLAKFTVTAEDGKKPVGSTHEHEHPKYCKKWDCPHYAVKNESELFESRIYEETPWAQIESSGYFLASVMMKSFYPLFNYITGKNDEGRKMEMTVPVMTKFSNIDSRPIKAVCHFYLPLSYGKLPKPLDSRVTLSTTPTQTKFYVRTFTGYVMTLNQIRKQRDSLVEDLQKEGMKFDKTNTYFASYNKPTAWTDRHNEVWIAASK